MSKTGNTRETENRRVFAWLGQGWGVMVMGYGVVLWGDGHMLKLEWWLLSL